MGSLGACMPSRRRASWTIVKLERGSSSVVETGRVVMPWTISLAMWCRNEIADEGPGPQFESVSVRSVPRGAANTAVH